MEAPPEIQLAVGQTRARKHNDECAENDKPVEGQEFSSRRPLCRCQLTNESQINDVSVITGRSGQLYSVQTG